jgi:hypothetical protein
MFFKSLLGFQLSMYVSKANDNLNTQESISIPTWTTVMENDELILESTSRVGWFLR